MNPFSLRAEFYVDGKLHRFDRHFVGSYHEDRRWLHAMRHRFDQELSCDLVKTGNLYRVERIAPRKAALLGRDMKAFGGYMDDGDWLDEALFPPSGMEVFAVAHSTAVADFNRRREQEE